MHNQNDSKSKLNRPSNIFKHHPMLSEDMFDARDGDEVFFSHAVV